ncbi:glycoside hydrolase family 43 protein [Spirosoma sp. BT702]|uniref:Glycoside hydrolase family 43 protein n=1 Tax=Spirosoma profusum TaxID=2771354 RepID=A0A926Y276_9BACT|nr:glycoside hydrolase family 43 protein [Spirosoma profusum]MBD2702827.1 glycoside hydrolase family 43 protein [Spirosoma profusum]
MRNSSCILILCLLLTVPALAQKFPPIYLFSYFKGNGEDGLHLAYSRDGYRYQSLKNDKSFLKPAVGQDKLMRDPCIIRGHDGRFHMVWTVSWKEKSIGYASSDDLIHWSEQQNIPVMAHEEGARNCWAPEITYDASSRQYMIYWSTTITGKFPETQDAAENAYNHRLYYTTTSDFKTYSPTKLLYDPGFNVIDANILPVGDRYVMFMKDETRTPPKKNIRLAFSNSLTGPYDKAGPPITGQYWAEGPTALRLVTPWIVYFDKYQDHTYGAVMSDDLKTWTDVSDKISFPKGARHGTVVNIIQRELDELLKEN